MNAYHNWFADPEAPLLAVELQYYRVPRDDWELMLARMRQMGANTISTYIMWGWHEPEDGHFDFNGVSHPTRDLVGFVRMGQELGFRMLVKPGPFIGAEALGGGIPSWLLARHPEIAATLRIAASSPLSVEVYAAALALAASELAEPSEVLIHALRRLRAALASGELPETEREFERALTRALGLLARAQLRPD